MSIAFKRIGVYLRVTLIVAAVILIAVVILNNRSHDTDVWFFHQFEQVNVVWVMLVAASVSVVSYWILRSVRGVARDLRQVRAENRQRKKRRQQEQREQQLAEQERRIDQKLQRALSQKAKDP